MKSQKLIPAKSSESQNRKILYPQIIVTIRYSNFFHDVMMYFAGDTCQISYLGYKIYSSLHTNTKAHESFKNTCQKAKKDYPLAESLNERADSTTLRKSKKKTSIMGVMWLFKWATRLARRQGRDAALPSQHETSASSFWGKRWRSAGGWKIISPAARTSPHSKACAVALQVVRPTA